MNEKKSPEKRYQEAARNTSTGAVGKATECGYPKANSKNGNYFGRNTEG
jgi:hypothetical protein